LKEKISQQAQETIDLRTDIDDLKHQLESEQESMKQIRDETISKDEKIIQL